MENIKEFVQNIRANNLKKAKENIQDIILNKIESKREKIINKYQTEN